MLSGSICLYGVGMVETCMQNEFVWHYCNMGNRLVVFFGVLATHGMG